MEELSNLTLANFVLSHKMAGQNSFVFHQVLADSTLPGSVPVGRLMGLPSLVVHRRQIAEVAGVAVS